MGEIFLAVVNEAEGARVVVARVLVVALLLQVVHLVNLAHAALLHLVLQRINMYDFYLRLLILS